MKTILLFHREELTNLYILLAKYFEGRLNVVHVAYSGKEADMLENAGIFNYNNYLQLVEEYFEKETIEPNTLEVIDELFIANTKGRFNLNSSIQSDRGFTLLSYEEALISVQVHYKCWKSIFNSNKVDFLLHEPCSLFFNHIAAVMCRAQGGTYVWNAQVKSDKADFCYLNNNFDDYSNLEIEHLFNQYVEFPEKIDIVRCRKFIDEYRSNYDVFMGDSMSKDNSKNSLRFCAFKEKIWQLKNRNRYNKLRENIDYWMIHTSVWRDKLKNIKDYNREKICFEEMKEGEKYFYYSFHLEPEAVVLYLGDGLYANQVKLIENIAASLPVGYYLYVKDHPHELAYRKAEDYRRLMQIPNVRLLRKSIPGKLVIRNAVGVFTINGTAGFEGLLLGKQVYCFGWSYYCYNPRVNYIKNIRELREVIYRNINVKYADDITFMAYINAFLDATHVGYINYYDGQASKNCSQSDKNARQIAEDLIQYIESFEIVKKVSHIE